MNEEQKLAAIAKRTKRRFTFSIIALLLYFSFALAWTDLGAFLSLPVAGGLLNGALVLFISLIIIFISLEFLFMRLSNREANDEQDSSTKGA